MRRTGFITMILLALALAGCYKYEEVEIPSPAYPFMNDAYPLPESKSIMEGVYWVAGPADVFGEKVVVKWTRTSLLIATENGRYFVLQAGHLDSLVILQGYWRNANNDETGSCSFYISREEGGAAIITGDTTSNIIIRGAYGNGSELPANELTFTYSRPFSEKVKNREFYILAHRGGGRTSDRLPVSENSIAMINYTEKFGSTGIEVDVNMTNDGVPFLYHDDDINIRLTQKGPLHGNISNFSWNALSSYVRLIHGEKIPSLEEALQFTIDSTDLKFVYLDMKTGGELVNKTIEIQRRMLQHASETGRNIIIVLGIPTQEILDDFLAIEGHQDIPSLCELTTDDVRNANSLVWAPRWTQGTQLEAVQAMHNEGRLAVTWTVDVPSYIKEFIEEGDFDGLLTNFPSIVAYYHYIQ